MRILRFSNSDNSLLVEYTVSMYNDTDNNFQVSKVDKLEEIEEKFGMQFTLIPYTLSAFKQFAEANSLKLTMFNLQTNAETTVVNYTTTVPAFTNEGDLGDATRWVKEVATVQAIAESSGNLTSKYYNIASPYPNGSRTFKVYFTLNGVGTAPTIGAGEEAVQVNIGTADTAATVGGKIAAALNLVEDFVGNLIFTSSSNGSGLVTTTFNNPGVGAITNGDAGLTISTTTQGVDGTLTELQIETEGFGANPDLTFAVSSGTLPVGLSLNTKTGVIYGKSTDAVNTYGFDITVTDNFGREVEGTFSIDVV
jgi:hypothetical protein